MVILLNWRALFLWWAFKLRRMSFDKGRHLIQLQLIFLKSISIWLSFLNLDVWKFRMQRVLFLEAVVNRSHIRRCRIQTYLPNAINDMRFWCDLMFINKMIILMALQIKPPKATILLNSHMLHGQLMM